MHTILGVHRLLSELLKAAAAAAAVGRVVSQQ